MKKIYCLDKIAKVGTNIFGSDYSITTDMAEANAVLVRSSSMHEMEFGKELHAIARAGAGVNNIPLEECASKGIVVFNTPGANANGVKELVVCGMLLAARDVSGGINWVKSIAGSESIAKDVEKGKNRFAGTELKGKTIGVIGLGAIGAEVANIGASLGMEVLGYDPYISVNSAWRLSRRVKPVTDLQELISKADYISLHLPLNDKDRKMINAEMISGMKNGVVVLNFSRDLLVDDDAMEAALLSGKVKKYVTDFPNERTANMQGCISIPHLGASTKESEDNCAIMAAEQIREFINNGNIRNSVNYPNCDMGICHAASRVTVMHKNIPNMIGQITATFGRCKINILDMTNKSRDKYAYTMIDIESIMTMEALKEVEKIEGILKVRVIK